MVACLNMSTNKSTSGKGSSPRSCFSKAFKDNYDGINWSDKKEKINIDGWEFYIYREKWGWIVRTLDNKLCAQGLTKNGAIKSIERVINTYNQVLRKMDSWN